MFGCGCGFIAFSSIPHLPSLEDFQMVKYQDRCKVNSSN